MSFPTEFETQIKMYNPEGLYGFLSNPEGSDLHFHLSSFDPGSYSGDFPIPPIVGETVEVVVENNKVVQCNRITTPSVREGVVKWFDSDKGYGFIEFESKQIFLHRSEVLEGRLPLKGRRVSFYMADGENKSDRACYISVHNDEGM